MATRSDMANLKGCAISGARKRMRDSTSGYAQEHTKKKVCTGTRTEYTYAPYHDGFQWRKYGQKMIRDSAFPRCYYRCTYHQDHGCLASKHVEQYNSEDPPLYRVIYTNEHTCDSAISYRTSSVHVRQIADASLIKTERTERTDQRPPVNYCRVKQDREAIVSSLLTVIKGCDVARSEVMHDGTASLPSRHCTMSPMAGSSSDDGSPISPVLQPATVDDLKLDFLQVEPQWFEHLDLHWF